MTHGYRTLDLDRLYAAAEDDAALASLPDVVAAACGGRSAMMLYEDAGVVAPIPLMNYWPADACGRYFAEYSDADPWSDAHLRHARHDGTVLAMDAIIPPDAFRRTTIYNELLRPLGDDTARCLGLVLRQGKLRFQIGVHRAAGDHAFDGEALAAMANARDHVARAMRLRTLVAGERGARGRIEAMLDASDRALLMLDATLRIARATPAGTAILDADDGLGYRDGRLAVRERAAASGLRALVHAAASDRPGARTAMLCPRRSGAPAYRLRVLPAGRRAAGHVLILIDDPAATPRNAIRAFATAYGLTAAETALAEALAAGGTIEEIAAARGVARETVRSQLKSLFARTGTSRQSDLVRLLATLPGR